MGNSKQRAGRNLIVQGSILASASIIGSQRPEWRGMNIKMHRLYFDVPLSLPQF